jgi:hypothetical protein
MDYSIFKALNFNMEGIQAASFPMMSCAKVIIPVDCHIRLIITGADVIHSFAIIKMILLNLTPFLFCFWEISFPMWPSVLTLLMKLVLDKN